MFNFAAVCEFVPEITVTDALGTEKVMWNQAIMISFLLKHRAVCEDIVRLSFVDIEDIVQELLLSVLGAESKYRHDRGASPSTYAWVLCENRLIDMYRLCKKHRKSSMELHFDFDELQGDRAYELPAKFSSHASVTADVIRVLGKDEETDTVSALDISVLLDMLRGKKQNKRDYDRVIHMMLNENTQTEIADAFQVTQPSISLMVSKLRQELHACRSLMQYDSCRY